MMPPAEPMVSVCVITYNHEKYIKQALDSIISQHINFKYEIVIGEDLSTDDTRKICKTYNQKWPEIITLLPLKENLGIQRNFIRTLKACNGKYIAICEGDDFWTDPMKLQKQVEFLEKNQPYSSCAHQSKVIYENKQKEPHLFNQILKEQDMVTANLVELRKFHTASFVFRSEIIRSVNDFPVNIISTDRALFLLCSNFGPIKFFPQPMCIYRKNSEGISNNVTCAMLSKDFNIIHWFKKYSDSFPKNRFKSYLYYTMITYPKTVSSSKLLKYYLLFAFYSFSYFPHNIRRVLRSFRNDVLTKF